MSAASEALRNATKAVHPLVNAMARGLGLETQGRLMAKTPRDTGRAAGNWNISTGAPDTSTDESATKATLRAKLAEGISRINQIDFAGGEEMYATNGLPYIQALEDGHSKQAPAGMVALTVEELRPLADQIARRIAK